MKKRVLTTIISVVVLILAIFATLFGVASYRKNVIAKNFSNKSFSYVYVENDTLDEDIGYKMTTEHHITFNGNGELCDQGYKTVKWSSYAKLLDPKLKDQLPPTNMEFKKYELKVGLLGKVELSYRGGRCEVLTHNNVPIELSTCSAIAKYKRIVLELD